MLHGLSTRASQVNLKSCEPPQGCLLYGLVGYPTSCSCDTHVTEGVGRHGAAADGAGRQGCMHCVQVMIRGASPFSIACFTLGLLHL